MYACGNQLEFSNAFRYFHWHLVVKGNILNMFIHIVYIWNFVYWCINHWTTFNCSNSFSVSFSLCMMLFRNPLSNAWTRLAKVQLAYALLCICWWVSALNETLQVVLLFNVLWNILIDQHKWHLKIISQLQLIMIHLNCRLVILDM